MGHCYWSMYGHDKQYALYLITHIDYGVWGGVVVKALRY